MALLEKRDTSHVLLNSKKANVLMIIFCVSVQEIVDLREYIPSSEWDVLNTSATRHIRRYPFFDTDPYPELIFSLTLKRQSTFYIYLLVLPCILLSCLTLVLFWIPPQRPDRTAVGKYLLSCS